MLSFGAAVKRISQAAPWISGPTVMRDQCSPNNSMRSRSIRSPSTAMSSYSVVVPSSSFSVVVLAMAPASRVWGLGAILAANRSLQAEDDREADGERSGRQLGREGMGAKAAHGLHGGLVEHRVRRRLDHGHGTDRAVRQDRQLERDRSSQPAPARRGRIAQSLLDPLAEGGEIPRIRRAAISGAAAGDGQPALPSQPGSEPGASPVPRERGGRAAAPPGSAG